MTRAWLDVPYVEKGEAKTLGACWDPDAERWYAPRSGMTGLDRWAARPPLPEVLPGEDRGFGDGLYVDLVPASCWFSNVRSCVVPADWNRIRTMVYGRAGHRCEACGASKAPGQFLEAHERWFYDRARLVQRLRRLVCLCTRCHRATHFGLAALHGHDVAARRQLANVNGWTTGQVAAHIGEAFETWDYRNRFEWELDLGILVGAGVQVVAPKG